MRVRRLARARASAAPSVAGPVFAPQAQAHPHHQQQQRPHVFASRFSSQGRRPYVPPGVAPRPPPPHPPMPQQHFSPQQPEQAAAPQMKRMVSDLPHPQLSAVDAIGSGELGFRGPVAPRVSAEPSDQPFLVLHE